MSAQIPRTNSMASISIVVSCKASILLKLTDGRFKALSSHESKHASTSSVDSTPSPPAGLELEKNAEVDEIRQSLDRFSYDNLSELIIKAAEASPTTRSLMVSAVDKERQRQQRMIIYFDHYVKSISDAISVKDADLGSENKSDVAMKIVEQAISAINDIVRNAGPYASPDTHYNALATLRDIGSAIASSTQDTVGHEVLVSFRGFHALETGMLAVLQSMPYEEKFETRIDEDPDSMWAKLVEFYRMSNNRGVFEHFREVLNALEDDGNFVTDVEEFDDDGFDDEEDGDEDMEDYEDQDFDDNNEIETDA